MEPGLSSVEINSTAIAWPTLECSLWGDSLVARIIRNKKLILFTFLLANYLFDPEFTTKIFWPHKHILFTIKISIRNQDCF